MIAIVTEGPTRQAGTSCEYVASGLNVVIVQLTAIRAEISPE